MPFHANFEIDIVSALSGQLISAFADLGTGELSPAALSTLPPGQGVYQLHYQGSLAYVGKANDLPARLGEHCEKIKGRLNIDVEDVAFKCLYVHPNWTALAPEASLIRYYSRHGLGECPWNGNGFGPHDPGRDRETTDKPPDGFDARYPINRKWTCDWIEAGTHEVFPLLRIFKSGLPWLLRFQMAGKKSRDPHPDYRGVQVLVPQTGMPAEELLKRVAQVLPNWQATVFCSHMILYRENRDYPHGDVIWPFDATPVAGTVRK